MSNPFVAPRLRTSGTNSSIGKSVQILAGVPELISLYYYALSLPSSSSLLAYRSYLERIRQQQLNIYNSRFSPQSYTFFPLLFQALSFDRLPTIPIAAPLITISEESWRISLQMLAAALRLSNQSSLPFAMHPLNQEIAVLNNYLLSIAPSNSSLSSSSSSSPRLGILSSVQISTSPTREEEEEEWTNPENLQYGPPLPPGYEQEEEEKSRLPSLSSSSSSSSSRPPQSLLTTRGEEKKSTQKDQKQAEDEEDYLYARAENAFNQLIKDFQNARVPRVLVKCPPDGACGYSGIAYSINSSDAPNAITGDRDEGQETSETLREWMAEKLADPKILAEFNQILRAEPKELRNLLSRINAERGVISRKSWLNPELLRLLSYLLDRNIYVFDASVGSTTSLNGPPVLVTLYPAGQAQNKFILNAIDTLTTKKLSNISADDIVLVLRSDHFDVLLPQKSE